MKKFITTTKTITDKSTNSSNSNNANNNNNNKVVEKTKSTTSSKEKPKKTILPKRKLNKTQLKMNEKYEKMRLKCDIPKSDWPEWRTHLHERGWAIVPNIVSNDVCKQYISRFWDWVEGFKTGVKRDDPKTWTSDNFPTSLHGIFQNYAIGHEQFIWDVRSMPEIIQIFEKIYENKELLVSFDGANLSRPTTEGAIKSWAHFDQGSNKTGFRCIQGFLNLDICGEYDGGLIVYEDSHLQHDKFFAESGETSAGDWYKFEEDPNSFKWFKNCKKIKVCCNPGDVVLWDSRTIHYACSPIKNKGTGNNRYVIYVSYQPASLASEKVYEQKQKAFHNKRMCSHWAAENIKLFPRTPRTYGNEERADRFKFDESTLPILNEKARKLAGLDHY